MTMTPNLRRAIQQVVAERGLQLSHDDVDALIAGVVDACGWVGDEEAMHLTGRTSKHSLRSWCSRHGVTRVPMTNVAELNRALGQMTGRTGRPRRRRGA